MNQLLNKNIQNKMIEEIYVSIKVAKVLKENGFDVPVSNVYKNGELLEYKLTNWNESSDSETMSAPTQQLVMKWLRDIKDVSIMVDCIGKRNWISVLQYYSGKDVKVENTGTSKIGGNGFDTYEEAVDNAIIKFFCE